MGEIISVLTNAKSQLTFVGFFTDLLVADILSISTVAKYAVTESLHQLSWEGRVDHVSCKHSGWFVASHADVLRLVKPKNVCVGG